MDERSNAEIAKNEHIALSLRLSEELSPGMLDYTKFCQAALLMLCPADVYNCGPKGVLEFFNKLETRGKITIGNYDSLKKILQTANLPALRELVKNTEQRIQDILKGVSNFHLNCAATNRLCSPLPDRKDSPGPGQVKQPNLFVTTKVYKDALELISKEWCVLLLAGWGDGKTTILQQISKEFATKGYSVVASVCPTELKKHFPVKGKTLFVFDDPFGVTFLEKKRVDSWNGMGGFVKQFKIECKFLFACHKVIWSDCQNEIGSLEPFRDCVIVDVSSEKFSGIEKANLLRSHFDNNISNDTINRIVDEQLIAFPEWCRHVALQKITDGTSLLDLFRNQFMLLYEKIDIFRNSCQSDNNSDTQDGENALWKYFVLVLVMLNKGMWPITWDETANCHLSDIRTMVLKRLFPQTWSNIRPCGKILDAAKSLCGTLLTNNGGEFFKFRHDSIYKTVAVMYGRDYPDDILKFCDTRLLKDICRGPSQSPSTCEQDQCIVKLDGQFEAMQER